jgi:hypothetical protein
METIIPQITNYYRNQTEMNKTDTQIQTTRKQTKTIPRNPTNPTRTSERRNPASNQ